MKIDGTIVAVGGMVFAAVLLLAVVAVGFVTMKGTGSAAATEKDKKDKKPKPGGGSGEGGATTIGDWAKEAFEPGEDGKIFGIFPAGGK